MSFQTTSLVCSPSACVMMPPKKFFRGGKWASLRDGPPTFMIEFSNFESVGSPVEVLKRMRRSKMDAQGIEVTFDWCTVSHDIVQEISVVQNALLIRLRRQ